MSYFQYQPHETIRAIGACGCGSSGCGSSMGAIGIGGKLDFSATKAWTGWKACSGGSQSLCLDAVDSIRAALGQLGYGQLSFGTPYLDDPVSANDFWFTKPTAKAGPTR